MDSTGPNSSPPSGDPAGSPAPAAAPVLQGPPEVLNEEAIALLDNLAQSGGEINEEDLELLLDQADPEFKIALDEIGEDHELKAVEVESDDAAAAYFEELEWWKNGPLPLRLVLRVLPFAPRITLWLKWSIRKLRGLLLSNWIKAKNWTHDFALKLSKGARTSVRDLRLAAQEGIGKARQGHERMSWKLKARLYLTLTLSGSALYVAFLVAKGRVFPETPILFLRSMDEVATGTYTFDASDKKEYFYDNVRSVPNLFLIPKILANLKRSSDSGASPMVAAEFFVEGFTPEVIIEMKDREPLLRDLAQRTIEEFSFSELDTPDGKRNLTEMMLRELNRVLTTGQLKAIRIKTLILKP